MNDVKLGEGLKGTYIYLDEEGMPRGIYFEPEGTDEKQFIAPYVPRKRKDDEREIIYKERIREDAEQVIKMIEESKEAVEEDARNYAISDTLLTFGSVMKADNR